MERRLKIVAISDTHSDFTIFQRMVDEQIQGDIFIHAGDFTRYGREEHFLKFFQALDSLNFTHKAVVAGNH